MNNKMILCLVAVVLALILASMASYFYIYYGRAVGSYPKSGLELMSGSVCYAYDGNVTGPGGNASHLPNVLQQFHLNFNQEFGAVLQFNVSAVEQNESLGNGPEYLLQGLTDANYWYEVGLSWNTLVTATFHRSGFGFIYQVWNATSNRSLFPDNATSSEGLNFSRSVKDGDIVLLSLKILPGENVSAGNNAIVKMSGYDWNTSASANASFKAFNSSIFVSKPYSNTASGLTTEWYVTNPNFCSDKKVVYSNTISPLNRPECASMSWNIQTFR
ncbi:MAG TPA: hypothetical protein VFF30_10720 [Nitrososphaerales archaeon]|nr:hypothetical protein [Nitrososphaerales archaeon]